MNDDEPLKRVLQILDSLLMVLKRPKLTSYDTLVARRLVRKLREAVDELKPHWDAMEARVEAVRPALNRRLRDLGRQVGAEPDTNPLDAVVRVAEETLTLQEQLQGRK